MEKLNIIWIVVDSIRNNPSSDKYGFLEVMRKFSEEGVEFKNTVSSAVSTLMSMSAMISSRPAYYLSRDFEVFKYDEEMFIPLTNILRINSYNNYTIHHYPTARKKMGHVLYHVQKKYWPKKINKHKMWDEEEINSIFLELIEKGIQEPFFLYIHYDVPTNKELASEKVEFVLRKLKEKNLYENSIIILCSDHGYPDPRREKLSLKQKVLEGHDLFVTDDNIMMPLLIKYPGCPKGLKITEMVSSLDIAPTILEILGISYEKYGFEGLNLLKIIGGERTPKRKIRTDTRYCFQPNKITSLKGERYKYVCYFDEVLGVKEKFFDLQADKHEKNNLIHSKNEEITSKVNEFKAELTLSKKKATVLQEIYLKKKFKALLNQINTEKTQKILIFGTSNQSFVNIILSNTIESFKGASVDLITKRSPTERVNAEPKSINFIFSNLTYHDLKKKLNKINEKHYDLVIIPFANRQGIGYHQIFKAARKIKCTKILKVDYNLDLINESNMWKAIAKDLKSDFTTKLFDWKNSIGNIFLLIKRIINDKYF